MHFMNVIKGTNRAEAAALLAQLDTTKTNSPLRPLMPPPSTSAARFQPLPPLLPPPPSYAAVVASAQGLLQTQPRMGRGSPCTPLTRTSTAAQLATWRVPQLQHVRLR